MANSKLNKIVTKVMDDIQDGTTKGKHCPYCGEKLFTQKTKLQGIWFHADANVKKKERKKRKREELKKKEKI